MISAFLGKILLVFALLHSVFQGQICLLLQVFLDFLLLYSSPHNEKDIFWGEYYSATKKNTFESVLKRWMNLEPIIQSEVSQKEKDKYHILMHIYRI